MPVPLIPQASFFQRVVYRILFPLNVWLSEETSSRLGLTPLDHERVRMALPYCRGRLLDVACGTNLLARTCGNGFGVDIHSYPGIDARCDSAHLPFRDATFDTVAILASLNHIVRRKETLTECHRVLNRHGRLLVTMIPAWVGIFSHPIRKRHDPDQLDRGIAHEEDWGLSTAEVRSLLAASGFRLTLHRRFLWWLNNFYMAEKVG